MEIQFSTLLASERQGIRVSTTANWKPSLEYHRADTEQPGHRRRRGRGRSWSKSRGGRPVAGGGSMGPTLNAAVGSKVGSVARSGPGRAAMSISGSAV